MKKLQESLKFEIGKNYKVFPKGALYSFNMTYEGDINNSCAFLNKLPSIKKIFSWRDEKGNIKLSKSGEVYLSNRAYVIYLENSKEYNESKTLLIKSDNYNF